MLNIFHLITNTASRLQHQRGATLPLPQ